MGAIPDRTHLLKAKYMARRQGKLMSTSFFSSLLAVGGGAVSQVSGEDIIGGAGLLVGAAGLINAFFSGLKPYWEAHFKNLAEERELKRLNFEHELLLRDQKIKNLEDRSFVSLKRANESAIQNAGTEGEVHRIIDQLVEKGIFSKKDETNKKSVLIVDDDVDTVKLWKYLLKSWGCSVEYAYNGAEALASVDPMPDVVLLDMMLPDVPDGLELYKTLKEKCPDCKIIIITADDSRREEIIAAAPHKLFIKPIKDHEALKKAILT